MKRVMCLCLSAVVWLGGFSTADAAPQKKSKKTTLGKSSPSDSAARDVEYLTKEVRKELVTIPFFGVFDWLEGFVQPDGTVTLRGEVTRPTIKSDAGRRVEKIEGVEKVSNEIEVLPLSPNDDRIRQGLARAIFGGNSPLARYGLGANPSIHLIVKNGRVTLKGVVANKTDSDIANIRANGVDGVFEVKNELRVEKSSKKK